MMFVLSDVDGVLLDYERKPRWDAIWVLHNLAALGFEIVVWSGRGETVALRVALSFGLPTSTRCFAKPDYPISLDAALALLGGAPVLQLDDDPTERVGDWPFLLIHCDGKMPGRKAKAA